MDLLDICKNFYDVAYYFHKEKGDTVEKSRLNALLQILNYGSEEKQKKILGIDCYLDSIIAKKELESGNYDKFIPILDKWDPKAKEFPIYSKRRIIEQVLLDKTNPKNTMSFLISERIKENYSIEDIEKHFESKDID